MISFIFAMDANRLIGKDNDLPWHLPNDLAYFKKVTSGHSIIMGRKHLNRSDVRFQIGKILSLPQRRLQNFRDARLSVH